MRTKAGFSLHPTIMRDLDALAFVRRESKSHITERVVAAEIAQLAPKERQAFEAARAARTGNEST